MTHVYLTGIELSEFRTFERLQVELAPEPGVLIVHGSNGLGKSSLFDALEWTLTGDIDHFTSVDGYEKFGNYLCRWGIRPDPTIAALVFSDGNRIQRRLEGRKAKASSFDGVSDIAEYLRLPDWEAPISSLNRYLLLTHFLGQSSLSRLTHRKPGERLEILKEVSRSAALQKFGLALHGPGQTTPARAFAKRISQLQKEAAELDDLLGQEEVLWSGAEAAGALDDGDAAKLSAEIAATLGVVWRKLGATLAPLNWDTLPDPNDIQSAIDRAAELMREREFAISEARRLLALQDRHNKTLAESAGASVLAEHELVATSASVEVAMQEAERRRGVLADAVIPLTAAREAHARVLALREAADSQTTARKNKEEAEAELVRARAALDDAERVVQRSDRRARLVDRLRGEVTQLEEKVADARSCSDRGQEWLDRASRISDTEIERRELEALHPDIDIQVTIATTAHVRAQATESTAAESLRMVEDSVAALSRAVSTIAAHLPKDAHDCPVCASHFPESKELSARAVAAAERLAPLVVIQQKAVADAKEAVTSASDNLLQIVGVQQRLAALTEQLRLDRAANVGVLLALGLAADVSRLDFELWLARQGRDEARLAASHQRRARWLRHLGADEKATSRAADAGRQRDAARVAVATAMRRLDDFTIIEKIAGDRVEALAAPLFPGGLPTSGQLDAAIASTADILKIAQEVYETASAAVSEQDLALAPLREALVNLQARVGQATTSQASTRAALSAISTEWRTLGWSEDDMAEADIEVAASHLNQARQSLSESAALLSRLRDGREAWSRQMAHRAAMERLRGIVDLAPNSTRDQVRESATQALQKIKGEVEATIQSKQIASSASDLIAEAVSAFNAAYLDPLKLLTNRINQAILCDPRIGIDLTLQKRGIKQSASVAGEMPKELDSVDPMLVHSEGQMAALAVSMLCAASLTYPWSRWRALILDDPLQHNDSIHAAAFADFVGNMVRVKDYQVLLTTHDLGQSEFLQRKFNARNIPCSVLNLLGRGENGVDWTFQSSSARGLSAAAAASGSKN